MQCSAQLFILTWLLESCLWLQSHRVCTYFDNSAIKIARLIISILNFFSLFLCFRITEEIKAHCNLFSLYFTNPGAVWTSEGPSRPKRFFFYLSDL